MDRRAVRRQARQSLGQGGKPPCPLLMQGVALVLVVCLFAAGAEKTTEDMDWRITLSFPEFLADLKTGEPELDAIHQLLLAGDQAQAAEQFANRFRRRPSGTSLHTDWAELPRKTSISTQKADDLLAGHLWDGYSLHQVPPEGLDWYRAPLTCLTRFPIFPTLQQALHHNGNPRYLRFMVDHVRDYMEAYPMADFVEQRRGGQGWIDDTTVARPWHWAMYCNRVSRMAELLAQIRSYDAVSDQELLAILHRFYCETAYMRREMPLWVQRRHNGGCAMIRALSQACAVLADFQVSERWREDNAALLAEYIETSFYPDGACVELTTAYSLSVAASVQAMVVALGDEDGLRSVQERLRAIPEWIVALGRPTGRLPSFGDLRAGGWRQALNPDFLHRFGAPGMADFAAGRRETPPLGLVWPAAGAPQWCGYYVMRSDWSPQALYLAVDGGPWGTTHAHGDRLSFVLTAWGQDFIIDPTSTQYRSNRPDAFISTQKAGFLHNTISIDGVDQFINSPREAQEPLNNLWEHDSGRSVFEASYSFAPLKPVRWTRRITFLESRCWVVEDRLQAEALTEAQIEQNFQFDAEVTLAIGEHWVTASAPGGARLLVYPREDLLRPVVSVGEMTPQPTYWPDGTRRVEAAGRTQERAHGRGWTGRGGHRLLPAPALTYSGRQPFPARLVTLLYPLAPGEKAPDPGALRAWFAKADTAADHR